MMAVGDDVHERYGLFVEFIPAGFDPRQIENFIDEIEQVYARIVNIGRIFLVNRDRVGAENFTFHHLGESEDGIERRPQFVAHLRQKPRLRDVGRFRAMACLVGYRFRLLKLADQRVFFGAHLQRCQRGRMQTMGEQRKIAFRGEREKGEHVIAEATAQHEVRDNRGGDRNGCGKGCDRKTCREHARYRDHQQHHEHHQGVRAHIRACRVDQDRHPAQAVEQIEQNKSRSPRRGCGKPWRLGEKPGAIADDDGVNAEHAAGPGRRRNRRDQEAEQQAGGRHQQHHDIGCRQARLGILPKQFAIESRTGSAGRR